MFGEVTDDDLMKPAFGVRLYRFDAGPRLIHRFFDSCPISPSGRYLALTRLPYEDHLPAPGDAAQILCVDLQNGKSRCVATSLAWDTQLGAQVQWGATDHDLLYNDMRHGEWVPFGVRLDIERQQRVELPYTIYHVSNDGKHAASACLRRISRTQPGYGVHVPEASFPRNIGAPDDDGITVMDIAASRAKMIVSMAKIVRDLKLPNDRGNYYFFHVKWNPVGDRLMVVVRREIDGKQQHRLITMNSEGSDLHLVIPDALWGLGGHHPNWCPDGRSIVMNLRLEPNGPMRLIVVNHDGTDLHAIGGDTLGSGHPTLHPSGWILTDAYLHEPFNCENGTVPLRWINAETGEEKVLCRVPCRPLYEGPSHEWRVDPHPAWDRSFRRIVFNLFHNGTRQVCLADVSSLLAES